MKLSTLFVALMLVCTSAVADDRISYGLGLGQYYSGLGVNVGLSNISSLTYLSAGCIGRTEGTDQKPSNACGGGIGKVISGSQFSASQMHSLSAYIGAVDMEQRVNGTVETVYGLSFLYAYNFSGFDNSGFNIGIGPSVALTGDKHSSTLKLQLGYQFFEKNSSVNLFARN